MRTRKTTSSPAYHTGDSTSKTHVTCPKRYRPSTTTSVSLFLVRQIPALRLRDSAWYLQSPRCCKSTVPRASPCHGRIPQEDRVFWSWGRRNMPDRRLDRPNMPDADHHIYPFCCDIGHRPSKPSFVEGLSYQSPRPWKRLKYADMPCKRQDSICVRYEGRGIGIREKKNAGLEQESRKS